jgi:hypothetical protein
MDAASMHSTVTRLLKITEEEQKAILRSFVKMPLEARVKVMEESRIIFYPLRDENRDTALQLLSYASLILAIVKYQDVTDDVKRHTVAMRSKSYRKQPKRDKLLGKWALIKSLKNDENLSFRQIAAYLHKYHKLSVVHSTIHDLWHELEINKKGEKENAR